MKLFINTITGKSLELEVEPEDTIESVKMKIQEKEGIPLEQQILSSGWTDLENRKTLMDYKLQDESAITLSLAKEGENIISIFINIDGQKTKMDINKYSDIKKVKEQIQNQLGINPEYQELSYNGTLLDNENTKIDYLGIKDSSVIDLKMKIKEDLGNDDNCNYKEKYKNELIQLNNMGYTDDDVNIQALKLNGGNVQYAIELLVNMYN